MYLCCRKGVTFKRIRLCVFLWKSLLLFLPRLLFLFLKLNEGVCETHIRLVWGFIILYKFINNFFNLIIMPFIDIWVSIRVFLNAKLFEIFEVIILIYNISSYILSFLLLIILVHRYIYFIKIKIKLLKLKTKKLIWSLLK